MKEAGEPEIKLFGRKIMLPENGGTVAVESSDDSVTEGCCSDRCSGESRGGGDGEKVIPSDEEDQLTQSSETNTPDMNQSSITEADEPQKHKAACDEENPRGEEEEEEDPPMSVNDSKVENDPKKVLKKPDKILPCPRCSSMDTKFCYYNNYNINQPRHFCKSCQRYWTSGGTMRNVPVGAGRRKTKNSTANCSHITISEALNATRIGDPHLHEPVKPPSGASILSFSPDSPLRDSSSRLQNRVGNGDSQTIPPQVPVFQNPNGFPPPAVPCIPCVPWMLPCPTLVPVPYWNWAVAMPNPLIAPWLPPDQKQQPAPVSPLGKHSRNGEVEGSIVVPKTLRIGDPEEAAKSPIWKTLGIKYDSISRETLFKALQPKGEDNNNKVVKKAAAPLSTTTQAMQANPAAMCRSATFHESAV